MSTLTVTAKGQLTLRKDVLAHLGVRPGDKVTVNMLPGGRVEISAKPKRTGHISDLFGMLRNENGPRLTIEEINRITEEGWAGKR